MTTMQAVAILNTAYPSRPMSDESLKLYTKALSDIHPETLATAVMNLIQTSKFMPSVAEIREEAMKVSDAVNGREVLPDAAEAWAMLDHAASTHGYDRGLQGLPELVRQVGQGFWHDICYQPITQRTNLLAQFRNAYNMALERRKEQHRIQAAIDANPRLSAAQKQNALKLEAAVKQLAEAKAVNNDGANS